MRKAKRIFTGLAALALAMAGTVGASSVVAGAPPEGKKPPLEQVLTPHLKAIYKADPGVADTEVPPPAPLAALKAAATANVVVTYHGFSGPAQTAFQTAVDIWETQVVAPVTIRVDAWWEPLDAGVLGQAGAVGYLSCDTCSIFPETNTWYAYALANQLIGSDYDPLNDDIAASFNSDFPAWYFGIDGNPPAGQYDFVSVVLHELAHGLGFIGSMEVIGSVGSYGLPPSFDPLAFDRFTESGAGTNSLSYPNNSLSLGTHLRSNDVWWFGSNTVAANGSRPKMYAPAVWEQGSSYSHLDETTYPAGDPRSLMTPALSSAEAIHDPGAVTRAMFADLGWTITSGPVEPPGAPTIGTATARPGGAVVSFTPPADNGGAPITEYRVYPDPAGWPFAIGTASPVTVYGLDNGVTFRFRVAAVNSAGEGPLSELSNAVTPVAGRYHAVSPTRILDTRKGIGRPGTAPLGPGASLTVDVEATPSPIPNGSGVSAVVVNATVTAPTKYGWLTLYPADQALPKVSNLNFVAGQTVPNLATVAVSATSRIKATNSGGLVGAGSVHVILDVVGWYDSGAGGDGYNPVSPHRILDTRKGIGGFGKLSPGQTISVDVTGGPSGVPDSGVSGVIVNATATGSTGYGWLTLFPSGEDLPTASNLNFVAGQTVPNLVAVKVGGDGNVAVNNSAGLANGPQVHVILDVVGWYGATGGAGFTPVPPSRIVDTRSFLGGYGKLGPGQTIACDVTGVGGVPDSGVSAVIVNTTVTGATKAGWLTLYPSGENLPTASNLNFVAGQTVPNLAVVKTGGNGAINAANSVGLATAGSVHVIMDVAGYFDMGVTEPTVPGAPTGVSGTPGDGQVSVSFSPPASNGGSPITGYTATASPGGATESGTGSPIVVTGLTNGTPYTFTVTATNAIGEGPPSVPSAPVTPAALPGAPTGVSGTPGDGQVTVSFTAPASDGGSPITGYTATASPGGATGTGSGSPIVVTGLTNGTPYTFTVTATNAIGTGPASAPSAPVTPTVPAGEVTEFPLPAGFGPLDITLGPDGNLWFTEWDGIGRITPAGAVTEFTTGITAGSVPWGITAGPDGNVWFTEQDASRIGRITPAGVVTEYSTGITPDSYPYDIVTGPDGNLWFTELGNDGIGRITPAGVVTEFTTGITPGSGPYGIASADGHLWFTEYEAIGRITTAGVVTEFSTGITPGADLYGITAGPGGNLWFADFGTDSIGRITPAGVITEFSDGITAGSAPYGIAAGPDGNLWFTEISGNAVGRITPTGVVTEYSDGIAPDSQPAGIVAGPDGNLWFAEYWNDAIGRITSTPSAASPPPPHAHKPDPEIVRPAR